MMRETQFKYMVTDVTNLFEQFKDEVFSMTKMIKQMKNVLRVIDAKKDFNFLCAGIRTGLKKYGSRSNSAGWEIGIRKINIRGSLASIASTTETLDEDYKKLKEQFQETLD